MQKRPWLAVLGVLVAVAATAGWVAEESGEVDSGVASDISDALADAQQGDLEAAIAG